MVWKKHDNAFQSAPWQQSYLDICRDNCFLCFHCASGRVPVSLSLSWFGCVYSCSSCSSCCCCCCCCNTTFASLQKKVSFHRNKNQPEVNSAEASMAPFEWARHGWSLFMLICSHQLGVFPGIAASQEDQGLLVLWWLSVVMLYYHPYPWWTHFDEHIF